ncbi:phosphate ABC transporter substrate-binding protein, PhoT family (TC 3.A.1.7.1) [Caminicella sporogenes DSM 14501]|uniref:Phosphate ABC transporter substrate-binding protein, PhoT family (TC 3.A.1.7.1) n=1 Tax=Caminicella sporogenes DSM 14501 TaxID=1121266 RepID=A0A1M6Q9B9_9FIRM|nr:phosphate ABC transporter substrate-binding protein [Caminicella sporogenes]RKD23629.1 ABC transporter substrate-binding protein [Caminicella sporogenes]SHK16852.1 phosphate ABC transporter substrate-binding protein, PhoT family (TC 3.A.1.7.1) [Caminicella sporogenes DSM 14501]
MKRYLALILTVVLACALFLSGCSKKDKDMANTEEKDKIKIGIALSFKGSSTLAPVITKLTKDFAEKYQTWDKIDASLPNKKIEIFVSGGGSGAGVKSIIDGLSNFGMVSRPVSDKEKAKIKGYKEYKLGTDALTIAVNPGNEIYKVKDSISSEELRKIFSGEYKYWDELDSRLPHEEIVLVTRDIGGGAHKVFQKKVMGDVKVSENVIQAPSMGALVAKIIENKNAIGYASFGVVNQNKGKIIPLKVDGVEPTKENIISGKYKISRPLLIITDGEIDELEKILIDYITSDEGMKVVEKMGFVPAR